MLKKTLFPLSLLFLFAFSSFAQITNTKKWRKTENDTMQNALFLYDEGKYLMALPMYEKLHASHPNEEFIKYVYGKCCLYRSDKHEEALALLTEVYNKNRKIDDIEYDLARASHLNYKFDEALVLLDKYMTNKRTKPESKNKAELLKKYCINGKTLYASPSGAKIVNTGNVLNTPDDEYVPVISADENLMIYTYRGVLSTGGLQNEMQMPDPYGVYYEDVFQSQKVNNEWTKPTPIANINTNTHDAAIALSADGQTLFVYRDNGDDHGDIYMSNLIKGEWSVPQKLKGLVNSYSWEGSCSMTADGKTLYFSSERGGGIGGKDIYRATLMPDSTWGEIKNLGDSINTPYDDDAPFIHPDGQTLFYSSKGKNSMGGYDLFQAKLNLLDSTFSSPVNLGYPINTTDDDIYYVLSANGERGYYASGKKGGYGLKDIYYVYPGYVGTKPVVYLVKGVVKSNKEPVEGQISVEITSLNGKKFSDYKSNAINGNYLISLPAGAQYKLTYTYPNRMPKVLNVSTVGIEGYNEKIFDVEFDIQDTVKPVAVNNEPKKDSVIIAAKEPVKIDVSFIPNNPIQLQTKEYAMKFGDIFSEGLIFKVQIAAYRYPKNYKYEHLKGLGKVENLLLDDGITRITIGGDFKTLADAFEHNVKVVKAGQKDAFVTAIYKGKRVYLEKLEELGIFKK